MLLQLFSFSLHLIMNEPGYKWKPAPALQSVFWQFVEFSLLGSFLTVGGVVRVACQGFLVRKFVSVFWWVELDFFSLECNEVSSNEL